MRNRSERIVRILFLALLVSLIYPTFAIQEAHANPACVTSNSTVNGLTVLEFDDTTSSDSNTTGSNVGFTCDWTVPAGVHSVNVAIVGGGGSGGYGNQAGGGGGGEVIYTSNGYFTTPNTTITLFIGAGGAPVANTTSNLPGNTGANSIFGSITAHGGGGGGAGGPYSGALNNGLSGGSSGGGDRFGTSVAPTSTTASGWVSLTNHGGRGAGLQLNPSANSESMTAGPSGCYAYGAGGGGGGAMGVGTDASASCTGNSASDSISVSAGNGGAGAYLMGKCVGGGGGSVAYLGVGSGINQSTNTTSVGSSPTPCIDPTTSQVVSGTQSGGYLADGVHPVGAVANSGGGAAAGSNGSPTRGSNGLILVSYDPTNPPVPPLITSQPQNITMHTLDSATETVTAIVNDGGTLNYSWRSRAAGSSTWNPFNCAAVGNVCSFNSNSVTDNGTMLQALVTNTLNNKITTTYSNIVTITVALRTPTISLAYPNSNTATYFSGETLTAQLNTNGDTYSTGVYSTPSSSSVCTVDSSSGLVSVTGGGTCVVVYAIPANNYYSAASKTVSISIGKNPQTLTWAALPNLTINAGAVTLGTTSGYSLATGNSATGAGAITYSTSSCSKFSVTTTGVITPLAIGTCSVTATQAATNYFYSASISESLTVVAAPPAAPFINSVSTSGGTGAQSGAVTVNFTDNVDNGSTITSYSLKATPASGPILYDTETVGDGEHSVTISGLTLGTAYSVSVTATNGAGSSSITTYSTQITPAGAPYAVTQLSATPGNQQLTITYVQPASLNGGTWSTYEYFIAPVGINFVDTPTATDSNENDTSHIFTGLTNGTAYNIKVVALTTANGTPTSANTTLLNMIPAIAPVAPSVTIFQTSASTATIQWQLQGDGGSALTNFNVLLTKNGSSQPCYTNLATTSCSLTGLAGLDALAVSISAQNLIGVSDTATATATIVGTVAKPLSLTSTPGDTTISIAFTQAPSGDVISTYLYSTDGTTFVDALTNQSPVVIPNLTNDQPATIYLKAVGAIYGAGPVSDPITDTPTATIAPTPPSNNSNNNGGGGGGGGYYVPPVVVPPVVVVETSTDTTTVTPIVVVPSAPDTSSVGADDSQVTPPPLIAPHQLIVIKIRFSIAFNLNSYFLDDAARSELNRIATKYKNMKIRKIEVVAFSTAGKFNPYPQYLGTERAVAIKKMLLHFGLKASYVAKYGGIDRSQPAIALRPLIEIYPY